MEDQIQKLELKITELENKLKGLGASHASAVNPDDLKVYQKLSSQLGTQFNCICNGVVPWHCAPCTCLFSSGIHVCRHCFHCACLCPCGPGACNPCSCTCAPCILGSGSSGGSGFSGFM